MFRIGRYVALGAAGFTLAGAAFASAGTNAGPLRCEIRAAASGGMVSLAAVAESDAALGGTYRFTVESVAGQGGSTIHQGGGFSVAPGAPAELGRGDARRRRHLRRAAGAFERRHGRPLRRTGRRCALTCFGLHEKRLRATGAFSHVAAAPRRINDF